MAENSSVWNVLLLDENEEDYLLLKYLLKEMKGDDFSLIWYQEHVRPIKLACSGLYDLIFTEYHYRSINGLELILEVHKECPDATLIMLTNWNLPNLEETAIASGAFAFLKKDELNRNNLHRTLQSKMNGSQ